ncbi:MAG: pyridoxal phosphate-dependent aminotransferase family protein [Thermoproteota archaeon]|nr:pyridoxal phosphate-dependent aminotransferase family protein [Thermoproteota archaeon]
MVLDQTNINYFKRTIDELKELYLYRELKTFDIEDDTNTINKKYKVQNFSSNDYLGLSKNKNIVKGLENIVKSFVSQCSSRLISGNSTTIQNLEKNLSKHRHTESALVFPNGYMANLGVLSAIGDKDSIILSDELNHASIIDGCKLSNSKIQIYPHNDFVKLENLIKKSDFKKKIIVTEGIFSMDGDYSNLKEISQVSKDNNCMLILDDAHGDFVIGDEQSKNYSGIPSFFGKEKDVDIHISSLSKGLGAFGGYLASSDLLCEFFINRSRPFIFTSALPDFLCDLASLSIDVAKQGTCQQQLYSNIDHFYKILNEYKIFDIDKLRYSPIIPIITGSEKKTLNISMDLMKRGFYVQAIRYPTVKKDKARLRISLSANHTHQQIENMLSEFIKIYKIY